MTGYRNLLFYIVTIIFFSALVYLIIYQGHFLEQGPIKIPKNNGTIDNIRSTYKENFTHPLAILLFQIIAIIVMARVLGMICRSINQPSVIGEIVAGIMLGPSLLGHFSPYISEVIFPVASLGNLQFISQIGLILFMFVVGMELDLNILKKKASDAIVISHASIILPFFLGISLSLLIYNEFAPKGIGFLSFSLFIGIALSITAFPVLARIIQERGLTKTYLGTIAITCAAADDITAWCILAVVVAIVKAGTVLSALTTIVLAVLYVLIMLKVIQPFLKRLGEKHAGKETLSKPAAAVFFITLLSSAYVTEVIGIHALFGAFLAGVVMPADANFRKLLSGKVKDTAVIVFLPLFFVFTGLRTEIGLLNNAHLWGICALIIIVAIAGKFAGSTFAAKFVGLSWKDSLAIGALMNTRGLMELIVLNIGYDIGVLSREIFTMMVIMALITTFLTAPILDMLHYGFNKPPKN